MRGKLDARKAHASPVHATIDQWRTETDFYSPDPGHACQDRVTFDFVLDARPEEVALAGSARLTTCSC